MDKQPNFFVIGVVKGGTTSLYHYLAQHPEVYLPSIKETNHFAAEDINEKEFLKGYALDVKIDLEKYIANGMRETVHIAHVNDPNQYSALFSKTNGEKAVGEISNSYMICPGSAKAIHQFNPEAKILVILRNPIRRAWSQYLMNLREAKTSEADFIRELKKDRDQKVTGWGVNHQYLELGMYSGQLKRYFDLFGTHNILPIFFEDYKREPDNALAEICRFLKIDDQFVFDFSEKSNASALPRNAGVNSFLVKTGILSAVKGMTPKPIRKKLAGVLYSEKNIPNLNDDDKAWLRSYYQSEVNDLGKLLSTDVTRKWPEFQ